jgi:hypothetical protein
MKKIFTILLFFISAQSYSQSTTLVISQVYGAGGNSGALLDADYVELHNVSGSAQSLSGFSIQYGSATGSTFSGVSVLPAVSIPAGKYYLIQMSASGANGTPLPTPDNVASPSIAMAAGAGKVVLVNGTTAITSCTAGNIIDFVGYGTTANCFEGTGPTGNISTILAAFRNSNGCTDTNDNSADFTLAAPAPRNGASAAVTCGAVSPTLTATALTAFGNVCVNTTTTANSFTITGTAINATNITVSALAGFTYATSVGGTYFTSLNLTQPGGAYSQPIFVKFTPTAVQSYNGNITIAGGGASSITVAASGAGVNSVASVTSGAATAITQTTATVAGNISANGCSAVTAYGVEYSLTNGFPNGSGTAVASGNLSGGNFTSALAGLTPGLTYYYHAYATNAGGTAYGNQGSFTTVSLTPVINVTTLTAFGTNVCINTVAGPNSFTINGTNLTAADILVGPLNGFSFSTATAGTYTASLTLTHAAGNYSVQIFVKFSPIAVQSYNGNIAVTGAGAPATSVAAAGAGVNTAATVTSGAATAITQVGATIAGTIPTTGCSAVSAYGIEYSTTNNFPVGTGTFVASTNLSGVNFSSALSGLSTATTYYYRAKVTNAGGTTYGTMLSFTTLPPVLTATPLTGFGAICVNAAAGPNSFIINSTAVTAADINVGPLTGYSFATAAAGSYSPALSIVHVAGPFTQTVYVKFLPTAVQTYNASIPVTGGGATTTLNVPVTGSGVNTAPTVATGTSLVLNPNTATLRGTLSNTGCSAVTSYGIEYSGISGLANGLGTMLSSTNLSTGTFSTTLNGLVQGGKYYYKAWAMNGGGISYGTEQSFTMSSIPDGFIIYSNPVQRGSNLHYTYKGIKPGHYEIQIFNVLNQLVYQRELIIAVNFIDDNFVLPSTLSPGSYFLMIRNPDFYDSKVFMVH